MQKAPEFGAACQHKAVVIISVTMRAFSSFAARLKYILPSGFSGSAMNQKGTVSKYPAAAF
jgi:hypothetical protein